MEIDPQTRSRDVRPFSQRTYLFIFLFVMHFVESWEERVYETALYTVWLSTYA